MPNLGPAEIMIVLVVALLIFGPKKLPELGKTIGQGIREFKRGTSGLKDELNAGFKDEPAATTNAASLETSFENETEPVAAAGGAPTDRAAVGKEH